MDLRLTAAIVALTSVATACAPSDTPQPTGPSVTVIDGVRIVQNTAPVGSAAQAWRISEQPTVTIGVDVGGPHEMLTGPTAVRLGDGRIVVLDRGDNEIRYFDAAGRFLLASGGTGEGPGEFGMVGPSFPLANNALLVQDTRLSRSVLMGSTGEYLGTVSLASHGMSYVNEGQIVGVFANGSMLVINVERPFPTIPSGELGWYDDGIFLYEPDGSEPRHLIDRPFWEVAGEGIAVFSSHGLIAAQSAGHFYYSNGRSFEVEVYDRDGTLIQRIHRAGNLQPVTDADKREWLARARERVTSLGGNRALAERLRSPVYSDFMPAVRRLLVDATGNLWTERHLGLMHSKPLTFSSSELLFEPTASTWDVFAPDGTWLSSVELVPGRDPVQIGTDWILTIGEDDAAVPHVWMYKLIKP